MSECTKEVQPHKGSATSRLSDLARLDLCFTACTDGLQLALIQGGRLQFDASLAVWWSLTRVHHLAHGLALV